MIINYKFFKIPEILILLFYLNSCSAFLRNQPESKVDNETVKESYSKSAGPEKLNELENNTRIIYFSGYDWLVRNTNIKRGPGPNFFSDSNNNVFVDDAGMLHLKITRRNNEWYCSSISTLKTFGYGKYIFEVRSNVDKIPENVVLGLFTWDEDPAFHNREINIEFTRWGKADSGFNSQFTVQPYLKKENFQPFNSAMTADYTIHTFTWNNDNILFESFNYIESKINHLISWSYNGPDTPPTGNEKVMINLWNFGGVNPAAEVELIIKKFEFSPLTETEQKNNLPVKKKFLDISNKKIIIQPKN